MFVRLTMSSIILNNKDRNTVNIELTKKNLITTTHTPKVNFSAGVHGGAPAEEDQGPAEEYGEHGIAGERQDVDDGEQA